MNISIKKLGHGYPVVLFHGWGFTSQIWDFLIPLLPEYQLIMVDLPGFGGSKLCEWDYFRTHLLSYLPHQFAVAGWSLGGLYATKLAFECPSQVSHLINIASSPYFLAEEGWPGISVQNFSKFQHNLVSNPKQALMEFVQLQAGKLNYEPEHIPTFEALELGLHYLKHWDLRPSLKQLNQATTYIFGRLDPIVPARLMTLMQATFPQFQYSLFDKAGHMPFLSHPNLFVSQLRKLIG